MDEEKEKQQATATVKGLLLRKLYLYSYIFLIVFAAVDILMALILLIIDAAAGTTLNPSIPILLYVSLGFAVVALILIAWLSALYFVDSEEAPSFRKIKTIAVLKTLIRSFNMVTGALILAAALLGAGIGAHSFFVGYGVVICVIEGVMFLYSLFHNAWVKENPERYQSPVYSSLGEKDRHPRPRAAAPEAAKAPSKTPDKAPASIEEHHDEPPMIEVKSTPKKDHDKKAS